MNFFRSAKGALDAFLKSSVSDPIFPESAACAAGRSDLSDLRVSWLNGRAGLLAEALIDVGLSDMHATFIFSWF